MSKPSESSISGIENQSEKLSSPEDFSFSDLDSNHSKDINLNSKNFSDFNLLAGKENGEMKNVGGDVHLEKLKKDSSTESGKNDRTKEIGKEEESDLNQDESLSIDSADCDGNKNCLTLALMCSTPKPESGGSKNLCNLFSISADDGSIPERESNDQTFVVAKSLSKCSLTDEEIKKKFEDLSFAFTTDSMTIQSRLHLMKRRRDQAETNIENELKRMKAKLRSLQFLGVNNDYVNLMSDLKKELDFMQTATVQLSSSAEGYGYVQHEERLVEFVSVMLQHVANLEALRNEASLREKLKMEGKRSQAISLDADVDEERPLRRRSVATVAMEGSSRRRASIATLPRLGSPLMEGGNGKGTQLIPTCRTPGGASKKLSFSQGSSSRVLSSSLPGADESRRDSINSRHRTDSRTSENSMKNIDEFPEQRSSDPTEMRSLVQDVEINESPGISDSSLHLRSLYESFDDVRLSSASQDSISVIYYLRRIMEWNKLILSATRFRWPDHVLHYVPFYITWYVVFVLVLVFFSGLFTGISGCYSYLRLQCSSAWLAVLTLFVLTRRFYRLLLPFLFVFVSVLIFFFILLTKVVLPTLTGEEINEFFKYFGIVLEVRYPYGPPPI